MKTYEGTATIKWYKNDHGDVRPLTIDCENAEYLKVETNRFKAAFMDIGENGRKAFSVKFDLSQRN